MIEEETEQWDVQEKSRMVSATSTAATIIYNNMSTTGVSEGNGYGGASSATKIPTGTAERRQQDIPVPPTTPA